MRWAPWCTRRSGPRPSPTGRPSLEERKATDLADRLTVSARSLRTLTDELRQHVHDKDGR